MPQKPTPQRRSRFAGLAIAGLFLACGLPKPGEAPGPLSANAVAAAGDRWSDADAASLEEGRQLFLDHCGDCHAYPALGEVDEDDWSEIVARMGDKASLSGSEADLLLQFILVAR